MRWPPFVLLIVLFPLLSHSYNEFTFDLALNIFNGIYYFKPNEAFGSSTKFNRKGTDREVWDVAGYGTYLTFDLNFWGWVKLGVFGGKGTFEEKLDNFNQYAHPKYKINHLDYGIDLKIFPMRYLLFVRLGLLQGISDHELHFAGNQVVPLFDFEGRGYQAGFGIDLDFPGICFGFNCGFEIEYLVRKAWATKMNMKFGEISYDETKKPSYREIMVSLGLFWFY